MQFTEARSEVRYPFQAGFIEIDGDTLPLDDLSASGLGFHAEHPENFAIGQDIKGFLVLQQIEEQYEMPVNLNVRRIEGSRIGCSMACVIPYHTENVTRFLAKLADG